MHEDVHMERDERLRRIREGDRERRTQETREMKGLIATTEKL